MLQKENVKIRADLERELTARQTLQLQVESKEQVINSLKAQLEASGVRFGGGLSSKIGSMRDSGLVCFSDIVY